MDENISVIIPVRNEEEKIMQCLEAVFSQSLKPHEVIVVDGHSSDRTVGRAREFPVEITNNNNCVGFCDKGGYG